MNKLWRLGVILVVIRDNHILLVRKSNSKEWQLPAGGREDKESVLTTAGRELMEETGINIFKALSVDISFIIREFEWNDEWKQRRGTDGQRQHIVIIRVPNDTIAVVDGFELDALQWVTIEESMKILTHKDMQDTLQEVLK
jgi:8-oxo-dGTP pyrophosphatase MutT (NUDIX family)